MADQSLFGRVRDRIASLAPTQDGTASPQARDEDPTTVGREEYREEVDSEQVEKYIREYYRNPLIRVPIQNFAADVAEPGVSVALADSDEPPTVPADAPEPYAGEPLDEALEAWLRRSYIDGFSFDVDASVLVEEIVKDRRGRRGTAVIEHAWDDPRERERLMALRTVKTETLTAYTREGKGIVLRPDDDPGTFDTVAINDLGDYTRDKAPTTPAGKTAAVAQFDEVFGSEDREEIPFALDDISVSPHDADTGALFGRPDSATVLNRAASLRRKLRHVDQSVINTAFGNVLATVETNNADIVEEVKNNLDVNVRDREEYERGVDPDSVSVTNAPISELHEVQGQVPDVVDIIQQEIEFVLAALPTPLYRVGFAGDINRDVTSEQGEDYRDSVKRERRRIESDLQEPLKQKARELLYGDATAGQPLDVSPELRIRPAQSESPLRDEEFDAGEFSELMSALSTAAGPKGGASKIIPEDVIIETFLDMDPEAMQEAAPGDGVAPTIAPPNEASAAVREAFSEFTEAELSASGVLRDVPVVPDDVRVLTPKLLRDWAAWVAAGEPDLTDPDRAGEAQLANWNPALHPRDPETGQFVERPSFDVPDSELETIQNGDPARLLRYISEVGARSDVEAVLQDESLTIDGVPDGIDTKSELVTHIRETEPEERLPPSAQVDAEGNADIFEGEPDTPDRVDLLEAEGSTVGEARAPVDTKQLGAEITAEMVVSKAVPEGERIAVSENGRTKYYTVQGYSRPTDEEDPALDLGSRDLKASADVTIHRATPRARAELSFDEWPERYSERRRVVAETFDAVVARGQNAASGRTLGGYGSSKSPRIDDETFAKARDGIADALADMDRETAEQTLARLSSVGDNLDRAHAGAREGQNRPRAYIDISEDAPQSTITHELGHAIVHAQGFSRVDSGAAHDMEFYPTINESLDKGAEPITDFSGFTSGEDPVEQFTIGYGNDEIAEGYDVEPNSETANSVGRSDWEAEVREEMPSEVPSLTARNFRNADATYLEDAERGDMVRATDPDALHPQNLSIVEIFEEPLRGERGFIAEGPDGDRYSFELIDPPFREGKAVGMGDSTEELQPIEFEVSGKRQTTPDGWGDGLSTPDSDAVLGSTEPPDSETAVRDFVSAANRAWFRMNLVANRFDRGRGAEFTIKGGYSSTNAHEVVSQTVEALYTPVSDPSEFRRTARRLVRKQPEVLEAWRHVGDVTGTQREILNEELSDADVEFRFGD